MLKYNSIIYDFDGVICDSVNIKTNAFCKLYFKYSSSVIEKVRNYHLENGGVSRFEKFKYFEQEILKKKITKEKINYLSNKFSNIVVDLVVKSNYIEGVIDYIKINKLKHQFICTGTPTGEMRKILKMKKIYHLFNKVYGSPENKISIVNRLIKEYNINTKKTLFFGDSMTDYLAANYYSIDFIGIENKKTIFPNKTKLIKNFNELM